jgi:hypothetical protein
MPVNPNIHETHPAEYITEYCRTIKCEQYRLKKLSESMISSVCNSCWLAIVIYYLYPMLSVYARKPGNPHTHTHTPNCWHRENSRTKTPHIHTHTNSHSQNLILFHSVSSDIIPVGDYICQTAGHNKIPLMDSIFSCGLRRADGTEDYCCL